MQQAVTRGMQRTKTNIEHRIALTPQPLRLLLPVLITTTTILLDAHANAYAKAYTQSGHHPKPSTDITRQPVTIAYQLIVTNPYSSLVMAIRTHGHPSISSAITSVID